ncbi:MAG TPA: hypothetical protein VKG43_12315 [Acidimicrobiales bacterium]|nr:hypothetical protein [Acidimicrobiales bacterium]
MRSRRGWAEGFGGRRRREAADFDALLDGRLVTGWWPLSAAGEDLDTDVTGMVDGLLSLSPVQWPAVTGDTGGTLLAARSVDQLIDARTRSGEWPLYDPDDDTGDELAGVLDGLLSLEPDEWGSAPDAVGGPPPIVLPPTRPLVLVGAPQAPRAPRPVTLRKILTAAAAVVLVAGVSAVVVASGQGARRGGVASAPVPARMLVADRTVALSPASGGALAGVSAVACSTADDCVAVAHGPGGPVTADSHDGGQSWVEAPAPDTVTSLTALTCTSRRDCIAVGSAGGSAAVITSSDGGTSWVRAAVPGSAGGLSALSCASASSCLAVGRSGGTASVVATSDGGATWSSAAAPAGASNLDAVTCTDASTCHVGGSAAGAPLFATSTDGAATWTSGAPSTGSPPVAAVLGAVCPPGEACQWLVRQAGGIAVLVGPSGGTLTAGPMIPQSSAPLSLVVSCNGTCPSGQGLAANTALSIIDSGAGALTSGPAAGAFACLADHGQCWTLSLTANGYEASASPAGSTSGSAPSGA